MYITKCLSLKQPYAELVVSGRKKIELRKWYTHFRGRFLIHASKSIDIDACRHFNLDPDSLQKGSIVGEAFLYGVKKYATKKEFLSDKDKHLADYSDYGSSKYGFMLKNARRVKAIKYRGSLNFFEAKISGDL